MHTAFEQDQAAAYTASRISWRAILAGAIVSVGLWILLHVMGLAAGLTSIDPNSPGSLRAAGIGTGIWSTVATLLSLFAGAFLAGRIAGPVERLGGALHGAVLWGLTTTAGLFMVVWAAGRSFRERRGWAARQSVRRPIWLDWQIAVTRLRGSV